MRSGDEHLEQCDACAAFAREHVPFAGAIRRLLAPAADDATARMWQRLSPDVQRASRKLRRRGAWRTLLEGRRRSLLAVLALSTALIAVLWIGSGGSRHDAGVSRAPRGATSTTRSAPARQGKGSASGASSIPKVAAPRATGARPKAGGGRRLRCGARLLATGDIRVIRDTRHGALVRLESGTVALSVPRLAPDGRLVVQTEEATVTVKGTRFRVRRLAIGTEVSVSEGVVWADPRGRGRHRRVLHAGQSALILGEAALLRRLLERLDAAIAARRLAEALRVARRYLDVTSKPRQASGVKLRLAALLQRAGRLDAAAKVYRELSKTSEKPLARQSAMVRLARLEQQRGQREAAIAVWQQLLKRSARGTFSKIAALALVRLTCGERSSRARRLRRELMRCCAADPRTSRLVARCNK